MATILKEGKLWIQTVLCLWIDLVSHFVCGGGLGYTHTHRKCIAAIVFNFF